MTETATILFTDVEGSTDLRTRLGDHEANRVLGESERGVREAVEAHGGEVVKQLGDGVLASFTSARSAVMAGLEIQRASAGGGPRVRVGVHAGEVVRDGGDLQGAAVHAAARIMSSAAGGEVLLSDSVRELSGLLPEGTRLVDRGLFWLKGFPERWRLYEAIGETAGEALSSPGRTAYVGRDDEVADLRRAIDRADGGHGSLVVIGGEPGVGKTRLAEEAAAYARRRGMLVFTGRCTDMEGAPPYLPFVEVLEAVAAFVPPEALRAALGDTAGDVARVIPELRRLFPDLPPPLDLPPEQERRYLLNAVRDLLARSARFHALVLILDDLHWADEPSLLLLEHLAEQLPDIPCLVIGTYRDVELEVSRPLARSMEGLLRRKLAERIALRRLGQESVRDLLAALAEQDPPDRLVDVIFGETEGNPFFVEEVFRHLSEEGRLFDERGRFRDDLSISEVDVPEGVRLVIGRRLERLSPATGEVLTAGAVIGRVFPYRVMAAVAEQGEEALLDAIDEAERAKLLSPASGGREESYAFSHELVRQTLLAGLTSARLRRLHLRAAAAIEETYGAEAGEHAGDLAHHLLAAGASAEAGRTVKYLLIAADRAFEAAAFEEALRHMETALALCVGLDERTRAETMFRLGSAQRATGRWEEALDSWRQALAGFEAVGDPERMAEVMWFIGYQLVWSGRNEELVAMLGGAVGFLQDIGTAHHARIVLGTAVAFASSGYRDGALEFIEKGRKMAEALDDDTVWRDLDQAICVVHWTYPGLAEAVEYGRRAEERMERAGALWDLASVLSFVAAAEALAGHDAAAWDAGERAGELAERLGHVGAHIYVSRALEPLRVQASCDLAGFVRTMLAEGELAKEAGIEWAEANAQWHVALAELWMGEWDEALRRARAATDREIPDAYAGWGRGALLLTLATAASGEEVIAELDRWTDELPVPGEVASTGRWMLLLFGIEALALIGEWDRIAELAPLLEGLEASGIRRRVLDSRSTDALRGLAAAARRDAGEAERWFEAATRDADAAGLRIEGAEVRRLHALAIEHLGAEPSAAKSLRADAAERYRELGMDRMADLASG